MVSVAMYIKAGRRFWCFFVSSSLIEQYSCRTLHWRWHGRA